MSAETIPGPEYWLMDRETMAKLEKEEQDREKLLDLARRSFLTSFSRYSLQTIAWPIGGAAGAAVYGGGAFLGIFAATKVVELIAGAPWPSIPLNEAAGAASGAISEITPPGLSVLLHEAAGGISMVAGSIGEKIPGEIAQKSQEIIYNVQVSVVSAISSFSAATIGVRIGGTYASNKAEQLGTRLGTGMSLQFLRLRSVIPGIPPLKED